MSKIPSFKEFNNQQLVKESYDLLEGSVSYDDLNDILNEGLFSFIKGIFIKKKKKRKLKKLGDQLFKIKVQIQKLDIERIYRYIDKYTDLNANKDLE